MLLNRSHILLVSDCPFFLRKKKEISIKRIGLLYLSCLTIMRFLLLKLLKKLEKSCMSLGFTYVLLFLNK